MIMNTFANCHSYISESLPNRFISENLILLTN